MVRLMKADFYRLSQTTGIRITLLVVAALGVLSVFFETAITSGVNVDNDLFKETVWDLPHLMQNTVASSSILNYCFISVFVILIGFEFSLKTYKNSLTSGTSRLSFVFAKYVTELVVLILSTFLFFVIVLVSGIFKYGTAGVDLFSIFSEMLLSSVVMGLMVSVLFSLATLILILTQSSIMAAVFIVIYPLIVQIAQLITKSDVIKYFDLAGFTQKVGLNLVSMNESLPYIFVGVAIILLSLVGSSVVIKHKEL